MKFTKYMTDAVICSIPVRVHWSVLFIFLYAIPFSHSMAAFPLAVVFYFFLILAHEIGHAAICSALGYKIILLDIESVGGRCFYESPGSEFDQSVISWGGLLSQFIILIISFKVLFSMEAAGITGSNPFFDAILSVFIFLNILTIFINLIPAGSLDGYYAWRIFKYPVQRIRLRINRTISTRNSRKQAKAKKIIAQYIEQITRNGQDSLNPVQKKRLQWARKNSRLSRVK